MGGEDWAGGEGGVGGGRDLLFHNTTSETNLHFFLETEVTSDKTITCLRAEENSRKLSMQAIIACQYVYA